MFTVKTNKIFFDEKEIGEVGDEIESFIPYKDFIIVQYDLENERYIRASFDEANRNVVAIDQEGKEKWRISKADSIRASKYMKYAEICLDKDGVYWALGTDDCSYEFNPDTGTVLGGQYEFPECS